jgi:hypothetical protein
LLVRKVTKEILDHKVQAHKEIQVLKEIQETQVHKEIKVIPEPKDLVRKEHKAIRVLKVI